MARTSLTAKKTTKSQEPEDPNQPPPANPYLRYLPRGQQPSQNQWQDRPAIVNIVDLNLSLDATRIKVKECRHRLQKIFLVRGKEIKEAELPECDEIFNTLAKIPMKKEYLSFSKVHKVLARIRDLEKGAIPLDEEYSFRERAGRYVEVWSRLEVEGAPETITVASTFNIESADEEAGGSLATPAAIGPSGSHQQQPTTASVDRSEDDATSTGQATSGADENVLKADLDDLKV